MPEDITNRLFRQFTLEANPRPRTQVVDVLEDAMNEIIRLRRRLEIQEGPTGLEKPFENPRSGMGLPKHEPEFVQNP